MRNFDNLTKFAHYVASQPHGGFDAGLLIGMVEKCFPEDFIVEHGSIKLRSDIAFGYMAIEKFFELTLEESTYLFHLDDATPNPTEVAHRFFRFLNIPTD